MKELSKCCLSAINIDNTCDMCGENCQHVQNIIFNDEIKLEQKSSLYLNNLYDLSIQIQDQIDTWDEFGKEELSFFYNNMYIQIKNEDDYNIYIDYKRYNKDYASIMDGISNIFFNKKL